MKKLFTRKTAGILLVASLITGSAAALGISITAAQAAANNEVASRPNTEFITPKSTPGPEYTPRPKDMSKEMATGLVIAEIERVFGLDASTGEAAARYSPAGAYYTDRDVWFVDIHTAQYDYVCALDSVTGEIVSMNRDNLLLPGLQPGTDESAFKQYRLLPGKSYYETVIRELLPTIEADAAVSNVRFLRSLQNTHERVKFNFIVTLETGRFYSVTLDKENYELLGYSVWTLPVNESLFEPAPDTEFIDIHPSVHP